MTQPSTAAQTRIVWSTVDPKDLENLARSWKEAGTRLRSTQDPRDIFVASSNHTRASWQLTQFLKLLMDSGEKQAARAMSRNAGGDWWEPTIDAIMTAATAEQERAFESTATGAGRETETTPTEQQAVVFRTSRTSAPLATFHLAHCDPCQLTHF